MSYCFQNQDPKWAQRVSQNNRGVSSYHVLANKSFVGFHYVLKWKILLFSKCHSFSLTLNSATGLQPIICLFSFLIENHYLIVHNKKRWTDLNFRQLRMKIYNDVGKKWLKIKIKLRGEKKLNMEKPLEWQLLQYFFTKAEMKLHSHHVATHSTFSVMLSLSHRSVTQSFLNRNQFAPKISVPSDPDIMRVTTSPDSRGLSFFYISCAFLQDAKRSCKKDVR